MRATLYGSERHLWTGRVWGLWDLEDMSFEEIAEETQIPEKEIRSWILKQIVEIAGLCGLGNEPRTRDWYEAARVAAKAAKAARQSWEQYAEENQIPGKIARLIWRSTSEPIKRRAPLPALRDPMRQRLRAVWERGEKPSDAARQYNLDPAQVMRLWRKWRREITS